jgi:hypothetical protein
MAYLDNEPRYTSLIDLIDGGGAGRSGESFEGGGLLSILANALMRPYGYENRLRDRKNDTGRAVTTSVDELMRQRAAMRDMERQRGLLQNLQDPRNQDYASGFQDPMQGYPDMSMQPIEGVTTPFTNPFAVGGGFNQTAPSAYPQADVASPMNTAKVTAQQNALEELAANLVADEMGEGFFTLPSEDRRRLIQNKYNELAISLDM